ncbi:uncharacterized protein LOC125235768 [Leguminivora glycinivorella]|uniref:uncharacterized protein LOC125235768 n=1 Tax=Leguminivora glycinivorella TaxID=1035111 RepID=UPI0020101DCA|nr:uncharacterized protein LOC125235768 [Leguminivora glycinivorella]
MYHPNQQYVNGYSYPQFFGIPTETVPNVQQNRATASSSSSDDSSDAPAAQAKREKAVKKKASGDGEGKKKLDTSGFSIEERIVAAAWVHERYHTRTSMGQIKQQFELRFGRPAPAKNTLVVWERKLFASGSIHDAPRAGRPAKRKLEASEVSESLAASPALSVRARAAELNVPRSTLRALMRHLPAEPDKPAKPRAARKRPSKPAIPVQPLF